MSAAHFRGVTQRFGEHVALRELDLEIHEGEVFGLLGPNGAGKTTALRILCGLLAPTQGTVTVGECDVRTDPLGARRRLAFVPDGAPLYPNLSARQHLHLVGRLREVPESELEPRTAHLLESLELGDRGDDPIGSFSRGMRQKAALACALIERPPLLVLDEPLTGLDAPTASVFKEVLREVANQGGTVLYTSHVLDVVERVCDRMAILSQGELTALGTLDELRERAGTDGTLEDIFATLAEDRDPATRAREILKRS